MSFLTDLVHGNFSNLGTDLTHAPASLASHPDELMETLAGGAALATGGLGLAGLGPLAGLGGAFGAGGDILTGGAAMGIDDASYAAASAAGLADADTALPAAASLTEGGVIPGLGGSAQDFGGLAGAAFDQPASALPGVTPAGFAGTEAEQFGAVTGTGGAAPGGSGIPSWLSSVGGGLKSGLSALGLTPAQGIGAGIAAGGLGFEMLRGQQPTANVKELQSLAAQAEMQGSVLQQYLANGTLPPALQAQLTQATKAAKASIISGYAARGVSTDPTQNSQLAQDLANVDMQAVASMGQIESQLLQTGIQETGLSSQLYQALVGIDKENNTQLMQAIASFASSLSGGAKTIKIG